MAITELKCKLCKTEVVGYKDSEELSSIIQPAEYYCKTCTDELPRKDTCPNTECENYKKKCTELVPAYPEYKLICQVCDTQAI